MTDSLRVIDVGGNGARRAEVIGTDVVDLIRSSDISSPEDLVEFATDKLPAGTEAIAYATAGIVTNHRHITVSPNAHWLDGVDLGGITRKAAGKPAIVCNDMEAAVTGMAALFPQLEYFLGITWSSGIGVRVWRKGLGILTDSEGGHMCLDPSPFAPVCGCGRRGCAEAIAGGDALARRVIAETQARGIHIPASVPPGRFLDESYCRHVEWACSIYYLIFNAMSLYLANLQSLLHLPAVVWKGSCAKAFLADENGVRRLRNFAKQHCVNPAWVNELQFLFSPEPPVDKDSFIGAAALAQKEATL